MPHLHHLVSLPDGIHGMVGLTFLRQFKCWGAERGADEKWRFFLVSDDEAPQEANSTTNR